MINLSFDSVSLHIPTLLSACVCDKLIIRREPNENKGWRWRRRRRVERGREGQRMKRISLMQVESRPIAPCNSHTFYTIEKINDSNWWNVAWYHVHAWYEIVCRWCCCCCRWWWWWLHHMVRWHIEHWTYVGCRLRLFFCVCFEMNTTLCRNRCIRRCSIESTTTNIWASVNVSFT